MKFADLHLHSQCSDGTYPPATLGLLAQRHGFSAIALTDHDTMAGCPAAARACADAGIVFVPGTELTTEWDGREIHLLGYYARADHPGLQQAFLTFQHRRQDRIREMADRMTQLGVPVSAEAVFALAQCASPGRPHLARLLVAEGVCASHEEAFDRFLKRNRPAWVPKAKIEAAAAIALIHQAGGMAVLAHPGLYRGDAAIPALAAAGLDGLECFHSKHTPGMADHYLRLAREYHLSATGGSDCHGNNTGKPTLGSVRLAYDYFEALAARAAAAPAAPLLQPG